MFGFVPVPVVEGALFGLLLFGFVFVLGVEGEGVSGVAGLFDG